MISANALVAIVDLRLCSFINELNNKYYSDHTVWPSEYPETIRIRFPWVRLRPFKVQVAIGQPPASGTVVVASCCSLYVYFRFVSVLCCLQWTI